MPGLSLYPSDTGLVPDYGRLNCLPVAHARADEHPNEDNRKDQDDRWRGRTVEKEADVDAQNARKYRDTNSNGQHTFELICNQERNRPRCD